MRKLTDIENSLNEAKFDNKMTSDKQWRDDLDHLATSAGGLKLVLDKLNNGMILHPDEPLDKQTIKDMQDWLKDVNTLAKKLKLI